MGPGYKRKMQASWALTVMKTRGNYHSPPLSVTRNNHNLISNSSLPEQDVSTAFNALQKLLFYLGVKEYEEGQTRYENFSEKIRA
jgi:hypothetical protein